MAHPTEAQEKVNGWLGEVASRAGLPWLRLDEAGACRLRYREGISVVVEVPENGGAVFFHATVGPYDEGAPAERLAALLERNYFAPELRGCHLALDRSGRRLALCLSMPLALLDAGSFLQIFGGFLEVALWANKAIAQGERDAHPAPASAAGALPSGQAQALRV